MTSSFHTSPAVEASKEDIFMSLQNVTISYGKFEAVKNVFMDIPR
jgi:phosphate transport system ATP-binding protein